MEMTLLLTTKNPDDEIHGLNNFIREHNLKGVLPKIVEEKPEAGTMSGTDYLPVIQMILGSTVIAAGVKGLFDVIKNYFDLEKQKMITGAEVDTSKIDEGKIEFDLTSNDGKKVNMKLTSVNKDERKLILETIDKVFNSNNK